MEYCSPISVTSFLECLIYRRLLSHYLKTDSLMELVLTFYNYFCLPLRLFIVCYNIVLISGVMSVFHNFCKGDLLFCIAPFYTACFIYVQNKINK